MYAQLGLLDEDERVRYSKGVEGGSDHPDDKDIEEYFRSRGRLNLILVIQKLRRVLFSQIWKVLGLLCDNMQLTRSSSYP